MQPMAVIIAVVVDTRYAAQQSMPEIDGKRDWCGDWGEQYHTAVVRSGDWLGVVWG